MIYQQNIEKLTALRLQGMADCYRNRQGDPAFESLSFDESLCLLLDAQTTEVEHKRRIRLQRAAKLKAPQACIEDIDYAATRGLPRKLMAGLNACQWLERGQNVFFVGATGTGKTWLACALANQTIRMGLSVIYVRLSRLVESLEIARADGSLAKERLKLSRAKLLVLDDWGVASLNRQGCQDLLEIIDDRSGGGVIITTQLPINQWHDWLGDPTIADAILDRIRHNAHVVELKGESMRKLKSVEQEVKV